jgi:hypothetical protein
MMKSAIRLMSVVVFLSVLGAGAVSAQTDPRVDALRERVKRLEEIVVQQQKEIDALHARLGTASTAKPQFGGDTFKRPNQLDTSPSP